VLGSLFFANGVLVDQIPASDDQWVRPCERKSGKSSIWEFEVAAGTSRRADAFAGRP
jgi:hypothetical protein